MTEPTHEYASLEEIHFRSLERGISLHYLMGRDEAARKMLRQALAAAWNDGWHAGVNETPPQGSPAQNPYHETDNA